MCENTYNCLRGDTFFEFLIIWRTHVSRVCTNQNEPQNVSSASSPVLRRCLRDKLKENQTGGGLSTRSMSVYERRR
ncbi:Ribosomal RNA small subunit methyltransferase G [Dissostichus eleginoides]|uniref:Ribosomal RNA small subunit methyltransferase G n=1 Tax=Dissostichus eleginoides TaxID=100907 RepID=A0AAD9BWT9_DISEL|nr:Ribosomal RNA small subunit methyltransferase G [Dissostichus eleginoides]